MKTLEGRIVAITGAGRGIGRAEALELARLGARLVVNNRSAPAGEAAVEEIRAAGGEAVLHVGDVSEMGVAQGLVRAALDAFGGLDVLVNNAGMVRDRMLVNMSEDEWDEVVRVNLKGCFAPLQQAARYWRDCSKAAPRQAAIINTTSSAGLFQNVGQTNYAAAKAGVASLTVTASIELARYGVTVNAVSPFAATEMSGHLIDPAIRMDGDFDRFDPGNIGPLIGWLAGRTRVTSPAGSSRVKGSMIGVVEGWLMGPVAESGGGRWTQDGLTAAMPGLVKQARPAADFNGRVAGS